MIYTDITSNLITNIQDTNIPVTNEKAIGNSLNNIMRTRVGSVPGHPEFGSNLDKYLFEQINPMTIEFISQEIKYAIGRWEPRVNIVKIKVTEDLDYNRILINLIYNIKTNVQDTAYEFIFTQTLV